MSIALMITDRDLSALTTGLKQQLPDVVLKQWPIKEIDESIDFVVAWKHPHEMWQLFPNLQVVSSLGAGVDDLITDKLRPKEVDLVRIVDVGLSAQMAEYVLSTILMHKRRLLHYVEAQHNLQWHMHPRKTGKKVTVLGMGEIGQKVALTLVLNGFEVSGWSRSEKNIVNVSSYFGENQLNLAVKDADYVVSVLPATNATNNILGAALFNAMPTHSCLINVGRGQALDESALLEALKNQVIDFAVLDVFKQEPLPQSHPFWQNDKLLVTPHISAITDQQAVIDQIVQNYNRFKQGKPLKNAVNLTKGY